MESGSPCLDLRTNTTIVNDPKTTETHYLLSLTGNKGSIYATNNATVTLKDIRVNASWDVYANDDYNCKLEVEVRTNVGNVSIDGGVYGFSSLTLPNDTKIIEPWNGYYDILKKYLANASGEKASSVMFVSNSTWTDIDEVEAND